MNIFLSIILFFAVGTNPTSPVLDSKTADSVIEEAGIKWKTMTNDLGQIPQNVPVTTTFEFKNSGKSPLIISNAKGSCGCTNVNFEKAPLPSGKKSTITATYNAKKVGPFTKTVQVYTNQMEEPVILHFKGEVLAQEGAALENENK